MPATLSPWRAEAGRCAARCDTDLTSVASTTATNDQVDHAAAAPRVERRDQPNRSPPAGPRSPTRIGFQALAELLDATLSDTAVDPFDLYTDPASLGPGLDGTHAPH